MSPVTPCQARLNNRLTCRVGLSSETCRDPGEENSVYDCSVISVYSCWGSAAQTNSHDTPRHIGSSPSCWVAMPPLSFAQFYASPFFPLVPPPSPSLSILGPSSSICHSFALSFCPSSSSFPFHVLMNLKILLGRFCNHQTPRKRSPIPLPTGPDVE